MVKCSELLRMSLPGQRPSLVNFISGLQPKPVPPMPLHLGSFGGWRQPYSITRVVDVGVRKKPATTAIATINEIDNPESVFGMANSSPWAATDWRAVTLLSTGQYSMP